MGVTNACLAVLSGLTTNVGSQTAFTYIAVGSGTTAFTASQTALVTELTDSGLERASVTPTRVTTTQTNDTSQWSKTWTASGTKTVAEVGVFNAASTGTMGSRYVLGTARSLVSGDTCTITVRWVYS